MQVHVHPDEFMKIYNCALLAMYKIVLPQLTDLEESNIAWRFGERCADMTVEEKADYMKTITGGCIKGGHKLRKTYRALYTGKELDEEQERIVRLGV